MRQTFDNYVLREIQQFNLQETEFGAWQNLSKDVVTPVRQRCVF